MRVVSLLATTLLLSTLAIGQSVTSTIDQPPAHPITPAQVHELLRLTGANQLSVQIMRGMMANLRKTFPPYVPKDVIDDLEARMESIDFEPMAVEAYQKHVSTEDAAQAIAFYKTPAGKRLVGVLPQVTAEMQASGAKEGMRIVQEVIGQHIDEIKAAAAKYREQQSDTPKITEPN
ncbi:MAG: DUF2059 domain-containing protein [Acidobacteriaceae bacterium]